MPTRLCVVFCVRAVVDRRQHRSHLPIRLRHLHHGHRNPLHHRGDRHARRPWRGDYDEQDDGEEDDYNYAGGAGGGDDCGGGSGYYYAEGVSIHVSL